MTEEFSNIDVDIPIETQEIMIKRWVRHNCAPASQSQFNSVLEETDGDIQHAIYHAILNEIVLEVLVAAIEEKEGLLDEIQDTDV